jgi:hypothetical protein
VVEAFGDSALVEQQDPLVLHVEAVQILSLEAGYLVQSQQRMLDQVGSRLQTVEGPLPMLWASPPLKWFGHVPEHFHHAQTYSLCPSQ